MPFYLGNQSKIVPTKTGNEMRGLLKKR